MALTLNSATLANPVEVLVDGNSLVALNIAYGGIRAFFHSTNQTQHQSIHTIELRWQALTPTELSDIRTHWQEAADAYVFLAMTDLELADFSASDNVQVTVAPGTALGAEFQQAYASDGTGPILYDASAIFISAQVAAT